MSVSLEQPARDRQTTPRRIKVVIVHSHRLIADALELLLNDEPDIAVSGKISGSATAADVVLAQGADVVIIDFRIDVLTAAEIASAIGRSSPKTGIIALARDHGDGAMLRAVEAGASGVICESDGFASVVSSVRAAAQGLTLIPPAAIADLLRKRRERDDPTRRITPREAETLELLADGLTSRQIAETLGVSYVTVRTHIRNLASKLAAHSKTELLARAYKLDLIAQRSRPAG